MEYSEKVNDLGTFLNGAAAIEQNVTTIRTNINRTQDLQAQILGTTSTQDEEILAQERNKVINNIRQLFAETKDRIKEIQLENSKIPTSDPNYQLRIQRFNFLREKFGNVLDEFHEVESTYIKQQSERIGRQYKVIKPNATQQEIQDYVSNPNSQPVFQQALLRTGEAKEAMGQVQRRHEDIKHIEKTIVELAELFEELNLQISAADTTIIEVESNVENTTIGIQKANEALGKAKESALSAPSEECPLNSKCPYYKAYHSPGTNLRNYNWDETNCPAANKCPYFEKIKKRVENDEIIFKEGGCPYVQNCPHAKSNHKRTNDDISKCPHLSNKIKNCPYIKNNVSPPEHHEL
ncbi:7105_t:CDS:2 [Diversispora eburnea]|uniref:7105_t:CDS:1 n=1 Tax=Diversispora eburnea TaxID=1213867 RepID=A0A9N9G0U4_9GLOM|nr:7105_t:CDS:2 [Diversispora eburnea]